MVMRSRILVAVLGMCVCWTGCSHSQRTTSQTGRRSAPANVAKKAPARPAGGQASPARPGATAAKRPATELDPPAPIEPAAIAPAGELANRPASNREPAKSKAEKPITDFVAAPKTEPAIKTVGFTAPPAPSEQEVLPATVTLPNEPPVAEPVAPAKSSKGSAEPGVSVGAKPDRALRHADDYTWVEGKLTRVHSNGGFWQIRYAPHDQPDKHGGSFILREFTGEGFQDGDTVRVTGQVAGADNRAKGTTYRVAKATKIPLAAE